jgi:hypothetical protein
MNNPADQCPKLKKHMNAHNGSFDLVWLQKHIENCNHCKNIMRYINAVVLPDILNQLDGEDRPTDVNN